MQAQYVDPKFANGQPMFNPALVAQQAQDPSNAAHPKNPKVGLGIKPPVYQHKC